MRQRFRSWVLLISASVILVPTLTSHAAVGPITTPSPRAGAARLIKPGDTFQVQYAGRLDRAANASVFDLDCGGTPARVVRALHRAGKTVVGYMSAGSWENYRSDANRFPPRVLGRVLAGWPDERWLDVRKLRALKPIMGARMDVCARKGFDAVDFDNVDGYTNRTGFPLTRADQLRYDTWLAKAAHHRGLQAGLKNSLGLIRDLVSTFDFAVNEQCVQYRECDRYKPFVRANKAVFVIEYSVPLQRMCRVVANLGLFAVKKKLSLNAWRRTCP